MGIVLNEHYAAEQAISNQSLGKKPSETLMRVARYYIDECKDITKKAVRDKLDSFLLRCEPRTSLPKWSDTLDYITSRAFKHEAVNIKSLTITEPEMKRIDSLGGKQVRRLAFVLLCLSKYWDIVFKSNEHWVNNKDSEIMAFANIKTSVRRQCSMYADLKNCGMIEFSKKVDNTHVKVCFAKEGKTAMVITDLRNLGYQYLKYHGESYFECVNCGITVKYNNTKKGRSQKYCRDCARDIHIKQSVNAAMRHKI